MPAAHAAPAPVATPVVLGAPPVDGALAAALVAEAPVHVKAAPVAAPVDRASKKRNKVGGADVEQNAAVAGIGTPYLSLCI